MDQTIDKYERRCPRLGSPVTFQYCKECGDDKKLCWKVIDCWYEYFDIMTYLKENLPENELKMLIESKPKPKISSIIELIAKAKENTKK